MKKVMIQYFEWYLRSAPHLWVLLAQEAQNLKDAGFTGVWMPPAYKGAAGINDVGYGVYDLYDLGEFDAKGSIATKYGTKEEYLACIDALHEAGLEVIADIVLNHKMGGDRSELVVADQVNPDNRDQTVDASTDMVSVYTIFHFPTRHDKYSDFHWNWRHFDGVDYDHLSQENADYLFHDKKWDIEVDDEKGNFDYLMGADIDFSNHEVVEECRRWGLWYLDTTHVDGFRLDAIKHIKASFYKEWLAYLREQTGQELFTVGEYWHGDLGHLEQYLETVDYSFSLFDVPLHFNMYNACHSMGEFDMAHIFDNTLVSVRPDLAVTFVDNHDTQPSQGLQSFIPDWFKPMAYALILLRDEGYPCVFYGDYYGIPHDKVPSFKEMIDHLLDLRNHHMYGKRRDYFDHHSLIGWSYEGDEQHDGLVVLMTNAEGGEKKMKIGKRYSGQVMTDGEHEVKIDKKGYGDFIVEDAGLSTYILKEMKE